MKKRLAMLTALALTLTLAAPALGADLLVGPGPARLPLTVEVDGTALDLTGKFPYQEGEVVMVPVRAVAEALGYTVTWTVEEPNTVRLDDGRVKTAVTLGMDSYYMASSTAIGMSKPSPLGAPPVAANGITFVPMDLFPLLGSGAAKVENVISFTKEKGDNMTQIPNPMVEYDTIEAAAKAAGITLGKLPNIPAVFDDVTPYVIGGDLLHVIYTSGDTRMIYRAEKGEGEIGGDYTVYAETKTAAIGDLTVTTKGADGLISTAAWQVGDYTYDLSSDLAMSPETLTELLK